MSLVDANVVSELRRPRPHGAVPQWTPGIDDADPRISAVTLGEVQTGVELTRGQNPVKAAEIEAWTDQFAATFNILSMGSGAFRLWARLMHGRSDGLYENAMITATAKVHGLIVVTRNIRDFAISEVPIPDPFAVAS